jgi:hypothetical protein
LDLFADRVEKGLAGPRHTPGEHDRLRVVGCREPDECGSEMPGDAPCDLLGGGIAFGRGSKQRGRG